MSTTFLSVRLPTDLRNRLKAVAARRGTSLQQLMHEAVEELLAHAEAEPPRLAEVIAKLRAHAPELRKRGVEHLYIFGSVARGDARVDSDVDVAIDVDPANERFSLLDVVGIQQQAEELLGRRVDLGMRSSLRASLEEDFERNSVQVF